MKNKNATISGMFLRNMGFIALVSVGLFCLLFIYDEYTEFSDQSASLREEYIVSQKDNLRDHVTELATYIQHMNNQAEERLKNSIREHVYEALQIAESIYQQNRASKSLDEIKKMIKDTLRPIRFNNGRGYYFAVSMDGVEQLYPILPELEGKNLMDLQDSHGNFVIRDEINIIKKFKEGFITDFWPKPDKAPGVVYPKISFVKYFKPLDWYFGTGEYLDDVKAQIQEEALNYIKDIRFEKEGYFFASTYQGDPLFSNGHITKGAQSIIDLTDPNGVKIFAEYQKAVENPDGGFIYYLWHKLNVTTPSPKISFVLGIPDWEWIIGAGSYIDTIEAIISKNKAALKADLINNILKSLLILFVLLLLCLFWARHVSNKIQNSITTFSSFFKKAAIGSVTINPDDLDFSEFAEIATSANKMLTDRIQAEAALRESEEKYRLLFTHSNDVIYSLDPELKILTISPSVEKLMGYTPEELIGRTFQDLDILAPEYLELAFSNTTRILSGESITSTIYEFIAKDGSRKFGELSGAPLYHDNKIVGIIAAARDITDRRLMEQALRESEEKYRRIFENIQDVYYETSIDGMIIELSPSVEKFFQYKREELIGKSLYDFYSDPQARDKLVERLIDNGKVNDYEIYLKDKDGATKSCSVTAILIKDSQGTPIRLVGSMRDISDRKQVEKRLQESEAQLSKAQSMAKIGNWEYDIVTGKVWGSEQAFSIYGIDRTSPLFSLDRIGASIPEAPRVNQALFDLIRENREYDLEYEVHQEVGGKIIWIHSIAELIWENDAPTKVFGVIQDITEKKLAEKEWKELKEQLHQAQKMESIGTLSGGIAHDFNNILSIIIGNTELAIDDVPEWNSAHVNLEEIKSAGLRAKNIVSQLLAFSRKTEQNLKPVAIVPVIKDALAFLRSTIPTTIDICADIVDTGETVLADPVQLNQIMMNLCINASHAMEESGGKLSVNVESVILDNISADGHPDLAPGDYVKITVSDTGPGLAPEMVDRIFDPYFTTKDVGKGSGMGLAVVHGIVKNHGGLISVDSEPGKGAVFTILLPKIAEQPEIKAATPMDLPTGSETILFVDDEASLMKLGQRMMERLGYKVDATISPTDALERFRLSPDRYDLVITDMTMPQMTGASLAEELMRIRDDIPVIICTGHSSLIDEEKAKTLNIAAFVMKPIFRDKIAKIIRQVLDRESEK